MELFTKVHVEIIQNLPFEYYLQGETTVKILNQFCIAFQKISESNN